MSASLRLIVFVFCSLLLAAPGFGQSPDHPKNEQTTGDPRAEVKVWGMTIVTLRATYRDQTPKLRAPVVAEHIEDIPYAAEYDIELLAGTEGDYAGAWIMVNGNRVFAVLDGDIPDNLTLNQFGESIVIRLNEWLARRQAQQSPNILLSGLLYSGLATIIFILVVIAVLRGRNFIQARLERLNSHKSARKYTQVGGIFLMPYLLMVLAGLIRAFVLFLMALFSYLWITFVLRQFPYTKGTGDRLTDYIVNILHEVGSAILSAIPDLIMVAIIFWLARFVNNILKNIFARIESGRLKSHIFDSETAKATRRVIILLVWIFACIIAYPYIPGSQTEAFKGVSVFLGLMVSLGSAGMVSQVLGGLIVVYSRAFQAGEYVKIGEHEGTVVTVGVLSTKIRTLRQEEISIPNAVLLAVSTTNFSRLSKDDGLVVTTSVTIGYDTPWRQVHELLLGAAEKCESVRNSPPPQVLQVALNDWYAEYRLNIRIDDPSLKLATLSQLHQSIQDAFAAAGVQIMSPHFVAQPDQAVLPPPEPSPSLST